MKYRYETPFWAVMLLYSVSGIAAIVCIFAFFYWYHWANDAPLIIRWFLLIIALCFLVVTINPKNWKPWRYFYADDVGIHFPSECPETKNTEWLTVPWSQVGEIKKELFFNRNKGPSIELMLSDIEINIFFRDLKLTKIFVEKNVAKNGYFKVGYSNVFKSTDATVKALNDYKFRSA